MIRYLIALVIAVALPAACSFVPTPPPPPTPQAIANEAAVIAGINATPADILATGVELVNNGCGGWFNKLTVQASSLDLAGQETALAGGVASGVAGLSGAGTAATAAIGIVAPAVSQSLANAARAATGGVAPPVAWPLVQKANGAFLGAVAVPSTKTEAMMDVASYAQQCSIVNVQSLVIQAQVNATPTAGGQSASLLRRVGSPSGINVPPVVTVGH